MNKGKKAIWGWAMYDWGNSAFATAVMAGFFPIFFKQYWSYGADVNMSTAQLGFGNSIASLFVAILAPVMGAIADKGSARKKFLLFFAYLGVLMTAALFLVQKGDWGWAIFVYIIGIIGFSSTNIFYDLLLPSVADEDKDIKLYKKAKDSGKPFDAVILDLTVKDGMGGKDAVKALLELDPQVKAIVSSGHSNDPVMTNFRAYGFVGDLPKPYPIKYLSDMLNQVLGKR